MSDKMRPIPFDKLIHWVLAEYAAERTIFGIPALKFHFSKTKNDERIFGEELESPIGPAAGPHTQLAQNIISAYLVGGRFFELKTVQKLDSLEIDKPCIDASDEGYNVEWSQELSLDDSFSEYLKAWFSIHLLKEILGLSSSERGFVFNMSVGYDLDGIKTERMDRFIEELKNASANKLFAEYRSEIKKILTGENIRKLLENNFDISSERQKIILEKIEKISPNISNSVTLSTMHGCPPQEIESIAKYLIQAKALHVYVKLNPTLLGYDFVNDTLHRLGFKYIQLSKSSFDHDLQYKDAIPMIIRLRAFAAANNRVFGIKLSNTLGVKNTLGNLPGEDMYMSGRSLFPLTINLAHKLADEFNGEINISYSGGANFNNIQEIMQTGIRPITFATELLKPGGYLRFSQIAEAAEKNYLKVGRGSRINLSILNTVAEVSLSDRNYSKGKHEINSIKISKNLPVFDCFIAPCQEACPIHQDVAAYIKLVEEKRYDEAYELIVTKNPLPHITGYICDHQCMYHCTRWDYDEPVLIRDLKKEAAEKGFSSYLNKFKKESVLNRNDIRVAIIGAGPSGLSAAYFLAKAGFEVSIFEKEMNAGGIVKNVLPRFRLPKEAIERDIDFIERHGIKFIFGADPDFSIKRLKKEGFKYIHIAIGAEESNKIVLEGERKNIFDAIEFLRDYNSSHNFEIGKSVAIIGGGNSAMDSARAAKRIEGVRKVYLIYRRTTDEMPADMEEFYAALEEEVEFKELLLPVKFRNGILTCQKMKLDKVGNDGRRNVVPLENEFEEFQVDSVISAIGESVDTEFLLKNKIPLERHKAKVGITNETNLENVFIGGDALRGPSTVVQSIADGKTTAEAIIRKEKLDHLQKPVKDYLTVDQKLSLDIGRKKGTIINQNHSDLTAEAGRCLGCNFICNKCVAVCPNRANVIIRTGSPLFKDVNQILHIDALCNECGNCETFCPYSSAPYKEKITLYWDKDEFTNGRNDGFFIRGNTAKTSVDFKFKNEKGTIIFDETGKVTSSIGNLDGLKNLVQLIKSVKENYSYLLQ